MKNKKIIIGSRGSKLALLYAEKAKKSILKNYILEANMLKTLIKIPGRKICLQKKFYILK